MTRTGRTASGTSFDLVGPSGAPLVILIHGLGLCRRLWDQHLGELSAEYQVLRYDLYGHGESGPLPAPATLSLYAEQIVELLDALGVAEAALVGFSLGGMINRRFAIDHAEHVWALAILNAPHDRGHEGQRAVEERAADARRQGPMATMDAALRRWFTTSFLTDDPAVPDLVRAWRSRVDPDGYAQAAWVLAHGVRELTASTGLPRSIPTLVITGANDSGSTPAMAEAIAAGSDASECLIIPGVRHLGLMEAPHAFLEPVLDFLARTRD